MKTEYQSRHGFTPVNSQWTADIAFVRENHRPAGATLWKREVETPEDADKRRLDTADEWHIGVATRTKPIPLREHNESIRSWMDRINPPPAVVEVQVEWDTLEPVKEVPVWSWSVNGVVRGWIAGVERKVWVRESDMQTLDRLTGRYPEGPPTAAIGHTRESALRNLAEMQGRLP